MKDVHAFEFESDYYQMSASSPSIQQINQSSTSSKSSGSAGSGSSVLGRFLKLGKSKNDGNSYGHSNSKRRGGGDVDAEDEFRLTISSSAQNLRAGGVRGAEKMVQRANLRKDNVSKSHSWIFGPSAGAKEHSPLGYSGVYGQPSPSAGGPTQFAADNYLQHSPSRHLQHQLQQHPSLMHPHPGDYGHSHHYFQIPAPAAMPMQMPMDYCHACQGTGAGAGLLAPAPQQFCQSCNISALTAVNASKFAAKNQKHGQKQHTHGAPEADSKFAFANSVRKLTWKSLKQAVKKRPSIDSLKPAALPPDASWSSNGNFLDAVGGPGPGIFMSQDDVLNATTTNYFFPEKKYQKGAPSAYYGSCTDLFTGVGRNGAGGIGSLDHSTPPQHVTASVRVRPKRSRETWHFGGSNDLGPTPNYQQQERQGAYHSEWDLRNYTPYEEWLTVANGRSLVADNDNILTEDVDALKTIGEPFEVTLVHGNSSGGSASESGSIQNTAAAAAKINRPATNNSNCNGTTINGNNIGVNNGKGVIAVGSSLSVASSSSSTSLSMSSPSSTSAPDIYSNGGVKRFSILNNELNAYQLNKRNQNSAGGSETTDQLTDEEDEEPVAVAVVEGGRSRVRVAGQGITIAGHGHGSSRVGRSNSSSSAASKKASSANTANKGNHPHHLIISAASSESDLTVAGAKSSFSTFTGAKAGATTNVNVTTTRIGMSDDEFESQYHYSSSSSNNTSSSDSVNKVSTSTSTSSSSNNGNLKLRPIVKSQKREREREREQRENEDRNRPTMTTVEMFDSSACSANANTKNFAPSQSQSQKTASSATNPNPNSKYGALRRRKHGRSASKHGGGKNLLRETIYEEEDSGDGEGCEGAIENSSNGIYTVKIVVNSNSQSHTQNGGANPGGDYAYVKPILKTNSHYASVTHSVTNSTQQAPDSNFNSYSSPELTQRSESVNPSRKGVKFGGEQKKRVQFNKEKVVIMCGVDPDEEDSQSSEDSTGDGEEKTEESQGGEFEFESEQPIPAPAKEDYDYSDWNSCIQEDQSYQSSGSSIGVSVSVPKESTPNDRVPEEQDVSTSDVVVHSNQVEVEVLQQPKPEHCYNHGRHNRNSNAASNSNENGISQFNSHSLNGSSSNSNDNEVNNLATANEIVSSASPVANRQNNGTSSQVLAQVHVPAPAPAHHHQQPLPPYQPKYSKNQRSGSGSGKSQPPAQQNKRSSSTGSNRIKIASANSSSSSKSAHQQIEQVFAQVARVQDDKRKLAHQDHENSEKTRRAGEAQEMNTRNSSNLQTATATTPKAEQILINNKHQLINNKGRNPAAVAGAKIVNPHSLLFNDTTRIRLNQARPSLDQTFQNLNIAGQSKLGSGAGVQARNAKGGAAVRPSHSFRTSAPPNSMPTPMTTAPLRPREPPPPPPPARLTTPPNSAVLSSGARPQLPARPKSFPSTLGNAGGGAAKSHYARSPTTKAQISLPMPMLGFSTTNSNVGAMKMKPTANPEQPSQNSPNTNRTKSGGGRPLIKKSANSNSSLADKCEAVEKVLSQQLGKMATGKNSPNSPVQSKTSPIQFNESPVYANLPLNAAPTSHCAAGAGKPLPPPPVPPHLTPTPPTPTANELLRAKSNLNRPASYTSSNSSTSTVIEPQKAPQPQKEVHYAATDLFDVYKPLEAQAQKQRLSMSMEDEIKAHHSHYNGNTNVVVHVANNEHNNEESMMNTNQQHSLSPCQMQPIDLISSSRTQAPSPSPSSLPPPIKSAAAKMNGYGSLKPQPQIEDVNAMVLVGQAHYADRSNKSAEHVRNNAHEQDPLYDDVAAMNRKNSQVHPPWPCAPPQCKSTYAISPPKEAPPPVPPHSAVFLASLSKSTGAAYAERLRASAPSPTPAPVPCLSDANTSLVHFTEEDLIYDDTSAFSKQEGNDAQALEAESEPLYDDVLNFAKHESKSRTNGVAALEEQHDSGTESNSPPPPLPTSGPPVHLLPKISLELPVILSTAVPGAMPGSCNNTLKSIKEAKNKKAVDRRGEEAPAGLSKSHSDLTTLINETLRLSKSKSGSELQLQPPKFSFGGGDREDGEKKSGDEELLDRTRSLLHELNEKLAKFSSSGGNGGGSPPGGSSSSDSSSGVEEDYNSEKNYSLSLHDDDCSTLTPNSSTSSPASGSLAGDAAYKLSQVSKLVNETMALARGKFLDSMKLQAQAAQQHTRAPIEEPIYEEINDSLSKSASQEFQNRSTSSPCPIYADTGSEIISPAVSQQFDAKSIFDGASRGEILSFLESIRDRLAAVDSSSNSLGGKKNKSGAPGNGGKKSKKTKDIERNDSGIGSEAGSIVAILGAVGAAAAASQNRTSATGMLTLTLCKDCHSLPIEAAAGDDVATGKQATEICGPCARKRNERKEIIQEIYETELKYGRDLRIISDEFYNPIQVAGLLTKDQLELIFLNVAQLIEINVELTGALKASIEDAIKGGSGGEGGSGRDEDLTSVNIGRIFVDIGERMMSGFESYCTRQANAGALLTQLEKEKELLRIFLRVSQMENAVLRRMNLPAFLMVPVQRVTRYPLLLSRLLKVTSADHPSHDDLQMAAEQIEQHLEHMNNTTREVASHKLWKRISIINGGGSGCSSPIHRRSSTSSTNSNGNGELDGSSSNNGANARIRKMAFDVTNWTDLPDAFCIAISQLRVLVMNGKSFRHIHACLLARGKNLERLIHKMDSNQEQDRNLFFPPRPSSQQQPQEIDVKDVKLILVRVKNARLSLFREPLCLSNCIISQGEKENETADADAGFVEVNEITTKNSLHFQGMDRGATSEWLRLLQCHAVCVGQWRRRRGALANVMMNGMIRHF